MLESSGVYPAFNKAPRQALLTMFIANLLNSSNLFLISSSFVNCKKMLHQRCYVTFTMDINTSGWILLILSAVNYHPNVYDSFLLFFFFLMQDIYLFFYKIKEQNLVKNRVIEETRVEENRAHGLNF